jgi:hypothetical protein
MTSLKRLQTRLANIQKKIEKANTGSDDNFLALAMAIPYVGELEPLPTYTDDSPEDDD